MFRRHFLKLLGIAPVAAKEALVERPEVAPAVQWKWPTEDNLDHLSWVAPGRGGAEWTDGGTFIYGDGKDATIIFDGTNIIIKPVKEHP